MMPPLPRCLRIAALLAAVASPVVSGCRTDSTNTLVQSEDGLAGSTHCVFVTGAPTNERLEVWAKPPTGDAHPFKLKRFAALQNAPVDQGDIDAAPPADQSAITNKGKRGLRTYHKTALRLNFNRYDCRDLSQGRGPSQLSYVCLTKAKDNQGRRGGIWATNLAKNKYKRELMAVSTVCSTQQ
jgi:hypothetical protein